MPRCRGAACCAPTCVVGVYHTHREPNLTCPPAAPRAPLAAWPASARARGHVGGVRPRRDRGRSGRGRARDRGAGTGGVARGRGGCPPDVLALQRSARDTGGGGSTDAGGGARPGLPAAQDGVAVLPRPKPGRAECSERRQGPNSNWLLARRQAGSTEPEPTMLMVLVL